MSSRIWVCMAGYRNYITYAGQKLNNKLRMAGYGKYISYIYVFISSFFFSDKLCGTKTEHSDVATHGGRIHVYIFIRVRFEQSTVAMYGGITKLFIIQIRFINSFF